MTTSRIEFDRQAALEKAIKLFWRYGYEATGLSDLLNEMGIGRQSLYNVFGSKHELFIEAVKHYNDQVVQRMVSTLTAPGSGVGNIRKVLASSASLASDGDYCGCLTNSIVELGIHDEEISKVTRAAQKRIMGAFKAALDMAVETGEISANTDTRSVARFLNATLHGIVVTGKASKSKAEVTDIVKVALASLQ